MRPPEQTPDRQRATESLRLALSMRGGVSLAVWIGGSVAEIESLRAASKRKAPNDRGRGTTGAYLRLLAMANYDEVEVDILTGASAGGLNGAIYSASLVYGFDFAEMAKVWLELADVESLSRPTTVRGQKRAHELAQQRADQKAKEQGTKRKDPQKYAQPPSLFDGDGYFLRMCEDKLNEFVAQEVQANGGQPLRGEVTRLDLFLSATRLNAEDKVLRNDSFNDIVESRSSALFHFRHLGALTSPLSDFGADPGHPAQYRQSVSRLAQSGRASSSFPVAFEPAKITSVDTVPVSGDNLFGMFSEIGEDVQIIDGGVLDNIPVAMAIEAIAAAPAEAPTSRWLLYLHPSPAEVEEVTAAEDEGDESKFYGILRSLKATLTLKFNNESLVDDMVALDRHNERVSERQSARRGLLQTAQRDGLTRDSAFSSWGEADARQIRTLLADPAVAAMTHPFVHVAYGDLPAGWSPVKRTALDKNLAAAIEDHYRVAAARADAVLGDDGRKALPLIAFGDTVEVLLRIAQQVHVDTGEPQRVLYRVRLLVEVLNAIWEQSWLDAAQSPPSDDPKHVRHWILRTAFECMVRSEVLTHELIAALSANVPADQDSFHRALHSHYTARVASELPRDDNLPPLSDLWNTIEPLAKALVDQAGDLDDPIIDALRDAMADDRLGLAWFATACAPLHRRHNDGECEIKFLRVAGSNDSPLSNLFTEQLDDNKLTVQNKLAGNQVANFGAFFSAQWRANDWMWGRLDTAKSLVDLLADSQRWFGSQDMTAEHVQAELKAIVSLPFANLEPGLQQDSWTYWLQERWIEHKDDIAQELDDALLAAKSNVSYPLKQTKRLLVARLQAELLSENLEWVANTGEVSSLAAQKQQGEPQRGLDYETTKALAGRLTAGTDKLPGALDTRRWARIGMRLGLNAWNALAPTGWKRFAVMGLKPVYLFLLAVVTFPRRALFSGLIGFGVLGVGRWEQHGVAEAVGEGARHETTLFGGPLMHWPTDGDEVVNYLTWQRLVATVVAAVLAALACYLQLNGKLPLSLKRRAVMAVIGTLALGFLGAGTIAVIISTTTGMVLLIVAAVSALVVAIPWWKHREDTTSESWAWRGWALVVLAGVFGGAVVAMTAFRASLMPLSLPFVAVFVVLVGMNWIPAFHRGVIAVLAAASYLVTGVIVAPPWSSSEFTAWGWWALGSFALANIVVTTYVSQQEVFPDTAAS